MLYSFHYQILTRLGLCETTATFTVHILRISFFEVFQNFDFSGLFSIKKSIFEMASKTRSIVLVDITCNH